MQSPSPALKWSSLSNCVIGPQCGLGGNFFGEKSAPQSVERASKKTTVGHIGSRLQISTHPGTASLPHASEETESILLYAMVERMMLLCSVHKGSKWCLQPKYPSTPASDCMQIKSMGTQTESRVRCYHKQAKEHVGYSGLENRAGLRGSNIRSMAHQEPENLVVGIQHGRGDV